MVVQTQLNQKTKFTRMCITEAIVALLQTTEYQKLKISDIVRKAGVARASFYKYYDSPYTALTDYLQIIITEYLEEAQEKIAKSVFFDRDHILYSLKFFDRYAMYFMTLARQKLHGIMLDGINLFMLEHITPTKRMSVYEMYSYAGGLLNTFLQWEEGGKKDSAKEVADTLYQLYCAG